VVRRLTAWPDSTSGSRRQGRRLFHQGQDRQLSLGAISKVTLADAQAAAKRHFALIADKKINPSTKGARATPRPATP